MSDDDNIDTLNNQKDKSKPCKVRRGFNRKQHVTKQNTVGLKMFSTNGAGIVGGKIKSLIAEVTSTNASLVTIQETHSKGKGKIQFCDMIVFEAIRKTKGGGTLIACKKELNPKLIEQYEDEFELLVVEIELKGRQIRVISGYGPQENWTEEKRMPFFLALETEVEKAVLAGKSVLFESDANSKLGPELIPRDPHKMSPNGAILASIVERQNLIVVNGSTKCNGTITRRRVTKNRVEESAIDLVLISCDMMESLVEMKIDEGRKHVLTKMTKTKTGVKIKESDHNVITTEFNLEAMPIDKEKSEMYNLNNKECQQKFKSFTSDTKMLSSVFESDENIDVLTKRFLKKLNGCIAKSFKRIRLAKKKEDTELYDKMRSLKERSDDKSKQEVA